MTTEALRNIDLNLLVAFSTLMHERSVSRAAARLFIGQSGMSGALARLRALFEDPLLVRVGRRLEPTPRALALISEVNEALAIVERAVGAARPFDPASSTRVFSLALTDNHELIFAGALTGALFAEAPRARLVFRDTHTHALRTALDDGEVDAALAVLVDPASWHRSAPLFEQGYACIWSPAQLPRWGAVPTSTRAGLRRRLSVERYTTVDHALVTFRGDLTGSIDETLAEHGIHRNVAVGVSRFAALPEVLAARPLVATLPTLTAERLARGHGLAIALPPVDLPPRTVHLVFRERDAALPELAWFRALVTQVIREAVDRAS